MLKLVITVYSIQLHLPILMRYWQRMMELLLRTGHLTLSQAYLVQPFYIEVGGDATGYNGDSGLAPGTVTNVEVTWDGTEFGRCI